MASVDLVARLVDAAVFRGLCSVPGVQLAAAISKGEFRNRRPDAHSISMPRLSSWIGMMVNPLIGVHLDF